MTELDRRPARLRILTPLRRRNFALLWAGMGVSLIGDGIYAITVVWEALRLSNRVLSVSLVGVAWTIPTVGFLLLGGALSDRIDRRRLMVWASLGQAATVGTIGVLVMLGDLHVWSLLCLVAVYGTAEAFFLPAFEAVIPMLVSGEELGQASALDQVVRPLALRLVGPAVGGLVISIAGTASGFLLDGATFLFSAGTIVAMRCSPIHVGNPTADGPLEGLREGLRFVKANPWLWQTLLAASLTLLLFVGPNEVVLPFLVKNDLHGGSSTLGLIRAVGGGGALIGALALGQIGLPGWALRAMFLGWALQSLTLAGFAVAREAWVFATIALLGGACGAVGSVVWGTLMKTRVPNQLLGRVASLDLLVSIGLVPVSFALAAPVAGLLGARTTLLAGGVVSAGVLLTFMFAAAGESRSDTRMRAREASTPAGASSPAGAT